MGSRLTKAAITGVSALALCGLGAGVAMAAPSATPATAAHVKHHGQHGEFIGLGKEHRTVDFQRGMVTSVSGSSMTVRSADGFTQTYTFGPRTKVRKDEQAGTTSQIQANDRVFVAATKEAGGVRAVRVRDQGDAPAKPHAGTPAPAPGAGTPITPQ